MLINSICRSMFFVLLVAQLPNNTLAAQPEPAKKTPSLTGSASEKEQDNSSFWSNPLIVTCGVIVGIYAGGAAVAAAIWYRIKDLFPEDPKKKRTDDDEYD